MKSQMVAPAARFSKRVYTDEVNVLFDVHDVDQLSWVSFLIRMFQHVYQANLFNCSDDPLEGYSLLLNELSVLLRIPIEARINRDVYV